VWEQSARSVNVANAPGDRNTLVEDFSPHRNGVFDDGFSEIPAQEVVLAKNETLSCFRMAKASSSEYGLLMQPSRKSR